MNEQIQQALQRDKTIDITTIGRKSGRPRRLEIWFHNLSGRIFITGLPGRRDWYANMVTNPDFTFHLKESVQADLPARARPITHTSERKEILSQLLQTLDGDRDFDAWLKDSPLVEGALNIK